MMNTDQGAQDVPGLIAAIRTQLDQLEAMVAPKEETQEPEAMTDDALRGKIRSSMQSTEEEPK